MEYLTFITAMSTGLSIYLFKKVIDMPKDYILKSDFKDFENRIENKLDRITEKLDKLARG